MMALGRALFRVLLPGLAVLLTNRQLMKRAHHRELTPIGEYEAAAERANEVVDAATELYAREEARRETLEAKGRGQSPYIAVLAAPTVAAVGAAFQRPDLTAAALASYAAVHLSFALWLSAHGTRAQPIHMITRTDLLNVSGRDEPAVALAAKKLQAAELNEPQTAAIANATWGGWASILWCSALLGATAIRLFVAT